MKTPLLKKQIVKIFQKYGLPVATFLLVKDVKLDTREESKIEENNKEIKQWKRIEVLKDYRF